jgi:hypothetical protein
MRLMSSSIRLSHSLAFLVSSVHATLSRALGKLELELVVVIVLFGRVRVDLEHAEVGLTRARCNFGRGGP